MPRAWTGCLQAACTECATRGDNRLFPGGPWPILLPTCTCREQTTIGDQHEGTHDCPRHGPGTRLRRSGPDRVAGRGEAPGQDREALAHRDVWHRGLSCAVNGEQGPCDPGKRQQHQEPDLRHHGCRLLRGSQGRHARCHEAERAPDQGPHHGGQGHQARGGRGPEARSGVRTEHRRVGLNEFLRRDP